MTEPMTQDEIYTEASKRVKAKNKFYRDLVVYVVANTVIFIIWAIPAGGGYPWFLWIMGFWGLALLLQFFETFVWAGKTNKSAIEKEAEKIRNEQNIR